MREDPLVYFTQVCSDWTGIENLTRTMAEMRCPVDKVCLTLEETDTIVKLSDHVQLLVCGSIASPNEWGVVCSHFGDVPV